MDTLSEQLRRACREYADAHSIGVLARELGMDKAAVSRLIRGERGLSAETLDRLGAVLGLKIVSASKPRKRDAA